MTEDREWKSRFATNLQIIMNDRGFTPKELAEACGVAESTISRYRSGQQSPSSLNVSKIARVLRCYVSDLIG